MPNTFLTPNMPGEQLRPEFGQEVSGLATVAKTKESGQGGGMKNAYPITYQHGERGAGLETTHKQVQHKHGWPID